MIRDVPRGFMRATGGMTLEEARAWFIKQAGPNWRPRNRRIPVEGELHKCPHCGKMLPLTGGMIRNRNYRCPPCKKGHKRAA